MINKTETAKIIGVGEHGILTLDKISDKIKNSMDIEKIFPNQDVDKDYVRELLDGVDVLYLIYNSEDKSSLQIVNAIGYMADERRVLSIGVDSATKENKDEVNLNREFKLTDENEDEVINLFNMMLDAISDDCDISIDITDLKEILASDKGLKYTQKEMNMNTASEEIADILVNSLTKIEEELTYKKELILIEASEKFTLTELNNLVMSLEEKIEDTYEGLFSLYVKPNMSETIKIALVLN